jgi:regulatory protein
MKITSIKIQARNNNRVNVSVDGKYRFSLDIFQVGEIGLKVGKEYQDDEIIAFESESQFGKLYSRALEYCFVRPRSAHEVRDYLYRKTMPKRDKTGDLKPGYSSDVADRVFRRLTDKGYIDDYKFARFWIDNRLLIKGASQRKLVYELRSKGVTGDVINYIMAESDRSDSQEIQKIISKKRSRYPDDKKMIAYLARAGFNYYDIKTALDGFE